MKQTLILLFLFAFTKLSAQDGLVRSQGEYVYHIERGDSYHSARVKALWNAQQNAIANAFGTSVSGVSSSIIENGKSHFYHIGESSVAGIWVKDHNMPQYEEIKGTNGLISEVKCIVDGYVRKRLSSNVECEIGIYCNGFRKDQKRTDFKSGNKFPKIRNYHPIHD